MYLPNYHEFSGTILKTYTKSPIWPKALKPESCAHLCGYAIKYAGIFFMESTFLAHISIIGILNIKHSSLNGISMLLTISLNKNTYYILGVFST